MSMADITIGRSKSNMVVIDDNQVSRHHALLSQRNGQYIIKDTNSLNGIYVNGKKVAGSQLLHPKDIVRIGNTTLPWLMYFTPGYIETYKVANNNDGENSLNKTERNTEKTRQLNSNENSYTITGFVLAFLMPVLGIVFCAIALNAKLKTKENKGFGFAVSGLVISIFNIVVRLIILSAIISAY